MTTESVKAEAMQLIGRLPESCTWDDVMYAVYVRQKIDAGLKDLDAGRFYTHEEIVREFANDGSALVAERPA
jgi:hypothetical protein